MKQSDISLYLSSQPGRGAERVMLTLTNGFVERGFNVGLVLAKAEGPYLADISAGVRVVALDRARVPSPAGAFLQ